MRFMYYGKYEMQDESNKETVIMPAFHAAMAVIATDLHMDELY